MGLGLFGEIKLALEARKLFGRLREEGVKGTLPSAIYGLVVTVMTVFVGSVVEACPALKSSWPAILAGALSAGVIAAIAHYSPATRSTWKIALGAVGSAIVSAGIAKFMAVCPGLWEQLPTLLMAAATTGMGLWMGARSAPAPPQGPPAPTGKV